MDKITKAFSTEVSISADEPRCVVAKISTAAVDRDGEVLIPAGCNSKDFEKNPVVFYNHDYESLPVGKCLAIKRVEDALIAKTEFAKRPDGHPADEEWLPDTLLSLFQQKVINGFSVGFTVLEGRPASERDIETFGGGCRRVFSKWKMLEYSVAPLPCNQNAVALAVSKGILKAATARKMFGDDYDKPAPLTGAKARRILIVSADPSGGDDEATQIAVKHAVSAAIAKRRGRIYI
jgi:phage head maturation protease